MPEEKKVPVLHCPTCYSTTFQISRVRPEDRLQLLLFKQPVRCRTCNTRIYASRSYAKWLRREEQQRLAEKSEQVTQT